MAGDQREQASRARAVAILQTERNRLREAIDAELGSLELCRYLGIPAVQLEASERHLALLRDELAEITPSRRQTADTTGGDTHGGA